MDEYKLKMDLKKIFSEAKQYLSKRGSEDVISKQEAEKVSEYVEKSLETVCQQIAITMAQQVVQEYFQECRGKDQFKKSLEPLVSTVREQIKPTEEQALRENAIDGIAEKFAEEYKKVFIEFDDNIGRAIKTLIENIAKKSQEAKGSWGWLQSLIKNFIRKN